MRPRIGIGIGIGGRGGIWYPWMKLPYFALPSTGVSLMVGQEVTIYGDELVNVPIVNNLSVTYTCDIGTQSGNNFTINPIEANIGDHTLSIIFRNNGTAFENKTITLSVYAKATAGSKTILMIGDSLLAQGAIYLSTKLDTLNAGLSFIGTQGTTTLHEGRPGWSYATFTEPENSPFYKAGVIDIAAYFTDNSLTDPDIIHMMLGVNACYGMSDNQLLQATKDARFENEILSIKKLVDAFFVYKSDCKIIVAIPTISENTGGGWNANYDESRYIQDDYIKWINKLSQRITTEFGTYDKRLFISYERINIDRNNDYLKIDGVHSNGVHLIQSDSAGYGNLGIARSVYINTSFILSMPISFTAAWENDYVHVTFTDTTGGVGQHEIWSSKNGSDYVLVTTLSAGTVTYNDATWQNASMNYKIRSKVGSWYSDFTTVVNISTPLILQTDQSTLAAVTINILNIAVGKTVNVDWGDGVNANYTGSNLSITHSYAATGQYYITFSGDTDNILRLSHINQPKTLGSVTKWALPSALELLYLYATGVTGNTDLWVIPNTLQYVGLHTTALAGDISLLYRQIMIYFAINNAGFSGDISNLIVGANTETFAIQGQNISGASPQITSSIRPLTYNCNVSNISDCNATTFRTGMTIFNLVYQKVAFPTANVDKTLKALADWYEVNTPTTNCTFSLNGTNLGVPTGGVNNVDRLRLIATYVAAGFTATVYVNS